MTQPTALYRHFDADGQLLYVGVSNNPPRRLWEHKRRAPWADQIANVSVKWMASREDALDAERAAIRNESPLFNRGMYAPGVYEPVGDAMRDWMGSTGISQYEIADAYGMSQATLSKMLAGKVRISMRFAAFIEDWSEGVVPMRYWLFGVTAEHHGSSGAMLGLAPVSA